VRIRPEDFGICLPSPSIARVLLHFSQAAEVVLSLNTLRQVALTTMALTLLALVGCATPVPKPVDNPPFQAKLQTVRSMRGDPVIALALGGGAARGFAHVGVLNQLEAADIIPDLVVGTSAGSVVGALYAGGIRGERLEQVALALEPKAVTDWMFPDRGVIRGERLQTLINDYLGDRPLEALDLPIAVLATDLRSGDRVALNRGNAGVAVRASSSVPGLVSPLEVRGRLLVDGGLVSQVPVETARHMGANLVIAVDVSTLPEPDAELNNAFDVLLQSMLIMGKAIVDAEVAQADVLIRPDLQGINAANFDARQQAIQAGTDAATAAIPTIREKIRAWHLNAATAEHKSANHHAAVH
jgi:NTE family protein